MVLYQVIFLRLYVHMNQHETFVHCVKSYSKVPKRNTKTFDPHLRNSSTLPLFKSRLKREGKGERVQGAGEMGGGGSMFACESKRGAERGRGREREKEEVRVCVCVCTCFSIVIIIIT